MQGRIVLLYGSERGKKLCDIASYILTQVAVAFGHPLSAPIRRCGRETEAEDALLDLCDGADGILAGESNIACLPALAQEMGCGIRARELRYTHLIENRSLMGENKPLNAVLVQALDNSEEALQGAAGMAYKLSGHDTLPIAQVPPAGKLADSWSAAVKHADSRSAMFHAMELALPRVIPEIVRQPAGVGVILCPPYAGSILTEACAALCGAPGMCYDEYAGGDKSIFAALSQENDEVNPFGMLRAVHSLLRGPLKLEREAACLEAGIRNVLQAGWRTGDIFRPGAQHIDADGICDLICQQIEVAGEWIGNE